MRLFRVDSKVQLGKLDRKTETDKNEIKEQIGRLDRKTDKNKDEIFLIIEKNKNEILQKTDKDKFELVKWMIGLLVGFSAIIITAIWAMLSFAIKNMDITSAMQEIISNFNSN